MKAPTYADGFTDGFERALMLVLGTKIRWTPADLRIRNKVTRKLFGKKRTAK